MLRIITFLLASIVFITCSTNNMVANNLDIQGHRGCRGLMPENTIVGFLKAVELGVNTLEMDVIISGDGEIIVSHEPFFNHLISLNPNGKDISEKDERSYNLFKMTTEEIQNWDVGSKDYPRFPLQSKIKTFKPTLRQVVDTIKNYIIKNHLPEISYNIEIKHNKSFDGNYHPTADVFTSKVYNEITSLQIKEKTCIQSFDPECLNILFKIDSTVTMALLVENKAGYETNLNRLTFKPSIYSPHFKLVDNKLLEFCKVNGIKIIPWTVNDEADIAKLIKKGVDGIISDYPDKVIEIYAGLQLKKNN